MLMFVEFLKTEVLFSFPFLSFLFFAAPFSETYPTESVHLALLQATGSEAM